MKHKLLALCAVFAAALTCALPAPAAITGLPDFTQLARDNSPAVVNISSTIKPAKSEDKLPHGFSLPDMPDDGPLSEFFRRFFGEEGPGMPPGGIDPRTSLGSGFIISADGYVITNFHVVREADEVVVRMSDRSEYKAEVIGSDPRSDIAVLKITTDARLPTVKLGSSEELEVGEWVLAIGSPFGFDYSVTAGIVSAKGRSLPNENYVPFIQTDVAINPGNSGGPLFNLDGEVVGVNSQIYSRTGGFMGVSFAIPIHVVMNVYEQLRDKGSVTRGWLGVLIQDVTAELAESFNMDKPRGALVSKVLADSPAKQGGLETGDVIVTFNGRAVEQSSDLPPIVGATQVGDKIPVEVIRGGKRQTVTIEIGALPDDDDEIALGEAPESKSNVDERLGVAVRNLDAEQREALQVDAGGVLIEDIENGPAYDAGLRAGDVVLQLNNQKITDAKQFLDVVAKLPQGKTVPVLVQRQGNPLFLAMKITPRDDG
ncbi:MAG: DegQ family serine endoprotease [Gammaproteobacteria bacterium]|nr:DegQ family serine endoprotease [Gammaproteobacteria bacterium]